MKVHLGNSSELSSPELVSVINKLHEVVNVSAVNANVGSEITSIISDLMLSQTDLTPLSNMSVFYLVNFVIFLWLYFYITFFCLSQKVPPFDGKTRRESDFLWRV